MRRTTLHLVICTIAVALVGCDRRAATDSRAIASPVEETVSAGDSRATVRVNDSSITTAGRVDVRLGVQSDAEVISLPEEPEFEGWTIVDQDTDPIAHTWSWTLEPFLDGAYTVQGIKIVAGEQTLETPPIEVLVSSVLGEGDEELAGMKGIVDAPPADRRWLWASIAGGSLALIGALAGFALMLAARARQRFELIAPAHKIALARLDRLSGTQHPAVEQLVIQVADITRRYIEDRYSVRAPEQTTEEFLSETRSSVRFREEDITLLERFLTRVDLIKFAGADADQRQADEACEAVRAFIASTGSHESTVALSRAEADELSPIAVRRVRAGYDFKYEHPIPGGTG